MKSKVYHAEKNEKKYWFVADSKRDIIEMYGFLTNKDIAVRNDVKPEGFFRYIYKDENGKLGECEYQFKNN